MCNDLGCAGHGDRCGRWGMGGGCRCVGGHGLHARLSESMVACTVPAECRICMVICRHESRGEAVLVVCCVFLPTHAV